MTTTFVDLDVRPNNRRLSKPERADPTRTPDAVRQIKFLLLHRKRPIIQDPELDRASVLRSPA